MLLETHEQKRKGNIQQLSANLTGIQKAFPQINLNERKVVFFFFTNIVEDQSSSKCLVLELLPKLQKLCTKHPCML